MNESTQEYIDTYMVQTAAEWGEPGCEHSTDHDIIGAFLGLVIILTFLGVVAFTHWWKTKNKK